VNSSPAVDLTLVAESVIDPALRDAILARFPSQQGATVADLLDMAFDHDWGLEETEPFGEEHHDALRALVLAAHPDLDEISAGRCVAYAALLFAMSGQPLVVDGVRDLAAQIAGKAVTS
jgi:hypothetical protein